MERMRVSECACLLNDAVGLLSGMYGSIHFDSARSIMSAETNDYFSVPQVYVGTKELFDFHDSTFSLGKAMVPIVGIFHEVCGHGAQAVHEYEKSTNLSSVLALNRQACKSSSVYYGLYNGGPSYQYYHQPCEIAAEYMGVRCAHLFLEHECGREMADSMIKAYDQYRYDTKSGCIAQGPRFRSVEGLLGEFESEFRKGIYAHRPYTQYAQYSREESKLDSLWNYAESLKDVKCLTRVDMCSNGLKQDWIMASAFVWDRDFSGRIQALPALERIDLDIEKALAVGTSPLKPKPKKRRMYLDELHDTVDALNERLHNGDELSL